MSEIQKKNWFARHKVLTGILVFLLIVIVASAASGQDGTNQVSNTEKTYRFEDRADKQNKDIELMPNETGTLDGVKMTVTNVEYLTQINEFDVADSGKTYVLVDVTLENTGNETKPYNVFDFRIQTASGQVLDPTFSTADNQLSSGDLVSGGKVSGKVVFEVAIEDGHQYLIWKPNAFNSARVIVQLK